MPGDITMTTNQDEIHILTRREIEAKILKPILSAFNQEFGKERTTAIVKTVITRLAEDHGQALAKNSPGNSLKDFAAALEPFSKDGANEKQVHELTDQVYSFNMTRCKYAEMYHALGNPELGVLLSCNRDFALCKGFNPRITLTRTQTIMEGALHCDFRFRLDSESDVHQNND